MKTTNRSINSIFLILLCVLFSQCEGKVKKEDLLKKRDKVQKNITAVKEDIEEAYKLKEKYLTQQKEEMIGNLEDRQLRIESEIAKLQDMVENSQSIADQEINQAIRKFQEEKRKIQDRINTIRNATDKNWMEPGKVFDQQLDVFQKSMENFMLEAEKLEAIKADSVL